MPLKDTNKIQ